MTTMNKQLSEYIPINDINNIIIEYQAKGINRKVLKRIRKYGRKYPVVGPFNLLPSYVKEKELWNSPKEKEYRKCQRIRHQMARLKAHRN